MNTVDINNTTRITAGKDGWQFHIRVEQYNKEPISFYVTEETLGDLIALFLKVGGEGAK